MLDQDKILEFLKETGPTLPSKVAKTIQTDILFASAFLSDLASQGKVKISNLKVGGSPLYYLAGQESQLFNFAQSNTNAKDYQVLERLKAEKVMRERDLELLPRVALRSLKDFAIPLHVTIEGAKEIFWKWHLLSDEETNQGIKSIIEKDRLEQSLMQPPEPQPELQTEQQPELQPALQTQSQPKSHINELQRKLDLLDSAKENNLEEKQEPPSSLESTKTCLPQTPLKVISETKPEQKVKAQQQKLSHEKKEEGHHKREREREKEKEEKIKKEIESKSNEEPEKDLEKNLIQRIKENIKPKRKNAVAEEFFPVLENFLTEANIKIEKTEIIRKNLEIDLLVKVPSVIGKLTYFCKAKKKAKCDEKDLASAYMEAQIKKLPLLFLYTKEFSKKAQEMLESGAFENVTVKRVKA
ncbi:MAG: hypothetical protein AABW48_04030 [Nanoarchaeota archaeon]